MREKGAVLNVVISIVALTIGVLAILFAWRVGVYYFAIKSGDTSRLPQFSSQLSFDVGAAENPAAQAERSLLETADDPSFGAEDAELVIVEFVDYECPFCQSASDTVRTIASRYADRVRVIVRDFPVNELHANALLSAEALGCAEEQDVYWAMHDRVYASDDSLTRDVLERLAEQSGATMSEFKSCMSSHRRLKEVEEDLATALSVGVRGTPTFFFNGQRVEGAIPEEMFEALIKGFLGE